MTTLMPMPRDVRHGLLIALLTLTPAGCSTGSHERVPARTDSETARAPGPAAARVVAVFTPSAHGFHFRNSFRGDPLPAPFRDSAIGGMARRFAPRVGLDVPVEFGFCGGMCAAATDMWLAGLAPPTATEPPAEGNPLYTYLRERNADSMGATGVMALKFIEWMGLPDAPASPGGPSTGGRTVQELGPILQRVEKAGVAHLGLVLVDSKSGKPWQNHQVLACGILRSDPERVELQVYDPNFPGRDDVKVVAELVADRSGGVTARSRLRVGERDRNVRGFFLMPYEPRRPPEGLW